VRTKEQKDRRRAAHFYLTAILKIMSLTDRRKEVKRGAREKTLRKAERKNFLILARTFIVLT